MQKAHCQYKYRTQSETYCNSVKIFIYQFVTIKDWLLISLKTLNITLTSFPRISIPQRDNSNPIIQKLFSIPSKLITNRFINVASEIKNFLQGNPDVFTKADKDHTMVALDKETYLNKMQILLNDTNTYSVVKKDPTRKIINSYYL